MKKLGEKSSLGSGYSTRTQNVFKPLGRLMHGVAQKNMNNFTSPKNEMPDDIYERTLARDMIEVHGTGAEKIARENARTAAQAGNPALAKRWIKILGIIQIA